MFKKHYEQIDDLNDLSFVNPDIETKSKFSLIFDIIASSINGVSFFLYLAFLQFLNISLLGTHNKFDDMISLELSMAFICIFGVSMLYGSIATYETLGSQAYSNNDMSLLLSFFHKARDTGMLIILILVIPFTLLSKYIFQALSLNDLIIENSYYNFIIYSVFIIYTNFNYLLNILTLKIAGKFLYSNILLAFSIIVHKMFLVLYSRVIGANLFAVYLSILSTNGLSWIISFFFVNFTIFHKNFSIFSYFSYKKLFKINEYFSYIKYSMINGLQCLVIYLGIGMTIIASMYLEQKEIISNIMLFNSFFFTFCLFYGFSLTFAQYVAFISYTHSYLSKLKYVKYFIVILVLFSSFISLIIYLFKRKIAHLYTLDENIVQDFIDVIKYYILFVFIHCLQLVTDGFIQGLNSQTSLKIYFAIAFLVIFFPLIIILSYYFSYGYLGFWISIFAFISINAVLNLIYIYKYHDLWIFKNIKINY